MIAQLDIFSEIASFLDFADDYVLAVADAYRLPSFDQLSRGIITFRTFTSNPFILACVNPGLANKIAKNHPRPEGIADYILRKNEGHPNFHEIIRGLDVNDQWTVIGDDRFNAIRFMAKVCNLNTTLVMPESIARLCKYDCVMQAYMSEVAIPLNKIRGYFHGRSLTQMYRLARMSFFGLIAVKTLARLCTSLDKFLGILHREGDRGFISYILTNVDVGYDDFVRLTEKYLA